MVTLKIRGLSVDLKWWSFPGGERNVKIANQLFISTTDAAEITCNFKGSDDLIDLLLLVNAVRNIISNELHLVIPYFPFARQDRVMTEGEPFALQVAAQLINSCNFKTVEVWDPHSDVLAGMFAPGVLQIVPQWEIWNVQVRISASLMRSALVSPDAGALKKIYKLAMNTGLPVIEASKRRDVSTGEIVETLISGDLDQYQRLIVVDDICDGGRTFIELANTIRKTGYNGDLVLCVTHGIFSKGLEPLSVYDKVYTINNMNSSITL